MQITLNNRADFTLQNFAKVAWQGHSIVVAKSALTRIDDCQRSFLALLEHDPNIVVYGVTSGYGQNASVRLTAQERQQHAQSPPFSSMTGFGEDLPERVKRAMVFSRLVNFIEGNSAVSSELVVAVTQLLQSPLPPVPALGNTSAGEIVPLSHLFSSLWQNHELREKEALSLINGSPCASAVMADIALSAQTRLALAVDVFTLAAEAIGSPLEHYATELKDLHLDAHENHVRESIRQRMDASSSRRPYQAPVSWRISSGVLGFAMRAQAQLQDLAVQALQSVTDNPVYLPPDSEHIFGQVLSNGGFHNAAACPAIDQVAGCYADLALLCDRQTSKLFDATTSLLPAQLKSADGYLGSLGFIAADYAEQARTSAQRTALLGSEGGGFGQNDVLFPVFHAWRKAEQVGRSFDACLAILAVTCSQAFYVSNNSSCPAALQPLLDEVRSLAPPLQKSRAMGSSVGDVADLFSKKVYASSLGQ